MSTSPMAEKAFSIHAHFYQPPREDPLTGEIPLEPGAVPYHNWNERIHDHCYRPNALLGNFERISFNMGPTLLDWMADFDPLTMSKIIEQDRWNMEVHGVGNAMAQAYNHTIMPLASRQDKITQVRWGIADFHKRYGHQPSGMWLPEAAVDEESLEILAQHGIAFVILAPWQADTQDLDTSMPYTVNLPNGGSITAFFYDQDLSTRISFDPGATSNADAFILQNLMPKYHMNGSRHIPELVLVASDGELYGHHQPFRDKFLSYLLGGAISKHPITPTYPALWLKQFPVTRSMKIRNNTSWSCHHGIERWRSAYGCTPHGEWKEPLREGLRQIAEGVDHLFLATLGQIVDNPWELRNEYIHVVLGDRKVNDLIASRAIHRLGEDTRKKAANLLAAQYERQRMFTSCGWFFDDFDRIEPRNNVSYCAQAVWLTYRATGIDLSPQASAWLRPVRSWRTGMTADTVFLNYLARARTRGLGK